MDILEKLEKYTDHEQLMNESFANFAKKYFPNVNVEKELIFVPGLTLTRMYMNKEEVWAYLAARGDKIAKDPLNNSGLDEQIKLEFKKVASSYDVKVLNSAIWKVEEQRKPGNMNKKEKEEFKKFKSWMSKLTKGWLKEYKAIAAEVKLNTEKLRSWSFGISPKKEAQAFEMWVQKVFGIKYKSKKKEWG